MISARLSITVLNHVRKCARTVSHRILVIPQGGHQETLTPRLDGAEWMLDRLAPSPHGFRIRIEPLLHGFENFLVIRRVKGDDRNEAKLSAISPDR